MRRLILKMSMSLDGFVAAADGSGGWMARSRDADGQRWVLDTLRMAGVHLLGRRTFEQMASFWPAQSGPIAAAMNETPKAVFTHHPDYAVPAGMHRGWADATVLDGDLGTGIARLKAEPGGDLLAQGGASLARALVAADLIDEYRLVVHPVALGRGLPLFADLAEPLHLDLVESVGFPSGTVARIYRPV